MHEYILFSGSVKRMSTKSFAAREAAATFRRVLLLQWAVASAWPAASSKGALLLHGKCMVFAPLVSLSFLHLANQAGTNTKTSRLLIVSGGGDTW